MLNAKRWIFISFKQPRVEFLVNQNVDSQYMEVFAFLLRETCVVEIFDEGVDASHIVLCQRYDPFFQSLNVHILFG